jgi:hypothetical protein
MTTILLQTGLTLPLLLLGVRPFLYVRGKILKPRKAIAIAPHE